MGLPSWFQWCYKNRLDLAPRYVLRYDILCISGCHLETLTRTMSQIYCYSCVCYIYTCAQVCISLHMHRGQQRLSHILFCHTLPFLLEMVLLDLELSKPHGSFCLYSAGVKGIHVATPRFCCGCLGLNSSPHASTASALSH